MNAGDMLFLYTDGVYDGSDEQERSLLEGVMREYRTHSAKDVCNAVLQHALRQDNLRRQNGDVDLLDDKTVFIIKKT